MPYKERNRIYRRLGFRGKENEKRVRVALCHLFLLSHFLP